MHSEGDDTIRNKSTVRYKDTTWDISVPVLGTARNKVQQVTQIQLGIQVQLGKKIQLGNRHKTMDIRTAETDTTRNL
jgi:hypothetical protein